jgi:UrcA family protein
MGMAAVLALGAGAARAQPYYDTSYQPTYTTGDITVYAPRHYERSYLGAPIETVRLSRVVYGRDLDLGTARGARILKSRIETAARQACDDIGDRYPIAVDSPDDCALVATRDAMHGVEYRLGFAPPTWPDLG